MREMAHNFEIIYAPKGDHVCLTPAAGSYPIGTEGRCTVCDKKYRVAGRLRQPEYHYWKEVIDREDE